MDTPGLKELGKEIMNGSSKDPILELPTETKEDIEANGDCAKPFSSTQDKHSDNTIQRSFPQFGSIHKRARSDQLPSKPTCSKSPIESTFKNRMSLIFMPDASDSSQFVPAKISEENEGFKQQKPTPIKIETILSESELKDSPGHSSDLNINYVAGTDLASVVYSQNNNRASAGTFPKISPDFRKTTADLDSRELTGEGGKRSPRNNRSERRFGHLAQLSLSNTNPININQLPMESLAALASPHSNDFDSSSRPFSKTFDDDSKGHDKPHLSTRSVVQSLVSDFSKLEAGCEPVWDRCNQTLNSAKAFSKFLRRRASIEEEYGKSMLKLIQLTRKELEKEDVKEGTFGAALSATMDLHKDAGKACIRFSNQTHALADELSNAVKDKEQLPKIQKETGMKLKKSIMDAEITLEKVKIKFLQASEGWDRALINKQETSYSASTNTNQSSPDGNPGTGRPHNAIVDAFNNIFAQPKTTDQLRKQEEEAKSRANSAKKLYHQHVSVTNHIRQEYYNQQLPDLISESISTVEEIDHILKSYMDQYASRYLNVNREVYDLLASAELGAHAALSKINLHRDNLEFFSKKLKSSRPINRDPLVTVDYNMSPLGKAVLNPKIIYGVDLQEQLDRDGSKVPQIVVKCVSHIEKHGINQEGIYRRSGSTSKVNRLRDLFNLDSGVVDLESLEDANDVDNVAGALKLYLRELPTAVVPASCWKDFQVSQADDPSVQLEALKSAINKLPQAHSQLLSYMIQHLSRISERSSENKMSPSNLSIIFGPTLFSPLQSASAVETMGQQCGVTMLLLAHSKSLFGSNTNNNPIPPELVALPPSPVQNKSELI